jgi:hypothetical protein
VFAQLLGGVERDKVVTQGLLERNGRLTDYSMSFESELAQRDKR